MIVIASTKSYARAMLLDAFEAHASPAHFCLPDDPRAQQATTAACWFPDMQQLRQLPELKVIHSMGAGIEHLNLEEIGTDYQICRIVDQHHKQGMLNYLQWGVLYYQRSFDVYLQQQQQHIWRQWPQKNEHDVCVGILGLGELGAYVAQHLAAAGYQVRGWSKSLKNIERVDTFAGWSELPAFLAETQILINLLPVTPETKQILSDQTFRQLPQGAAIINSGRGAHLNVDDLMKSLESDHLRGAILDVFEQEPLPKEHPLWTTPKVVMTPHVASHAPLDVVVQQILENDRRVLRQQPLINTVDYLKGY